MAERMVKPCGCRIASLLGRGQNPSALAALSAKRGNQPVRVLQQIIRRLCRQNDGGENDYRLNRQDHDKDCDNDNEKKGMAFQKRATRSQ